MKRAVSISIGSSKRDKAVEVTLLGEKVSIERIGTDGDMEAAALKYKELDGKVDAFGVGGADLGAIIEGKFYPFHSVQKLVRFVQKTPVVDGGGLKNTLENKAPALRAAFENGYFWLGFLEVRGIKAAASLNFDYKNKLWGYNSGVNRDFMELSPGWVLLGHTLQWACEHGRYEFDFMRGDEEYKYRLGGVNQYVLRAILAPRS